MSISHQQFLEQFENQTLDPNYFDHRGHIRLAWLYLTGSTFDHAHTRIGQGILRYATSLGAPDKFHSTLTYALTYLIALRIDPHKGNEKEDKDFESFLSDHSELIDQPMALVHQYFSPELLNSDAAKRNVLEPDKSPLPALPF